MYADRLSLYKALEDMLGTKLLVYVTGDKPGFETQISGAAIDWFIQHLNTIGNTSQISLYLYTRGGDTAAAWNIVNLIKMYCDTFEVIIPHKARSSGTLMSIGAKKIYMTKQATLGPIDPSINSPLNPQIPNASFDAKYPVSVEDIKGYIEWAKTELHITDDTALANILIKLSEFVHPLILGNVYRARAQIQMLARRLLAGQIENEQQIQKVIDFLCSESGSHDYTINRREAKQDLGLNVEKPTQEMYEIINNIYLDIREELQLQKPFDLISQVPVGGALPYTVKRVLIESIYEGSTYFCTDGILRCNNNNGQLEFGDERSFEGWKHEKK